VFNQTVRGLYCYRCGSRKVVRGHLGESTRFYPLRGFLQNLLGKPVFLDNAHSYACLECGLTWNEVDAYELRKNLREYGVAAHSTGVMKAIQSSLPLKPDISI
jgi:DNA-directed RNA polymerase subunit RPC12/RpoP